MTKPIEAMIEAAQTALGREGVYVGASTVGRALSAALSMPDSKDLQHTEGVDPSVERMQSVYDSRIQEERICTDAAMSQWERSLKRPDLAEKDRVRGAIEAYKRQAFAFSALSPLKVEGPSVKAMRTALEFYASEANWNDGHFVEDDEPNCITMISSTIDKDQGKLARSTLVEHDETAERGQ